MPTWRRVKPGEKPTTNKMTLQCATDVYRDKKIKLTVTTGGSVSRQAG